MGLALAGGALGLFVGLLTLGVLGSYWALGPDVGRPALEVRLIAVSGVLCAVTVLVSAGLLLRGRLRPARPLLLLAAAYGLIGGGVFWFRAALLAVAAFLLVVTAGRPLPRPQ